MNSKQEVIEVVEPQVQADLEQNNAESIVNLEEVKGNLVP